VKLKKYFLSTFYFVLTRNKLKLFIIKLSGESEEMEKNNKLTEGDVKDNLLLVNINQSYKKAIDCDGSIDREILY